MSMHTYHEDIHEVGLVDGCPRCEEHANRPFDGLDNTMLANLRQRIADNLPARSEAEDKAMFMVMMSEAGSPRNWRA